MLRYIQLIDSSKQLSCLVSEKLANVERTKDDLHDYQINKAVPFLLENPFSALFIDLGLGKSVISLTTILELQSQLDISTYAPTLVIAPIKVANNTWPVEVGIWEHTACLSIKHIRSKRIVDTINSAGDGARATFVEGVKEYLRSEGYKSKDIPKTLSTILKGKSAEVKKAVEKARHETAVRLLNEDYSNNRATIHVINREQVEWLVTIWGRKWPYKTVFIDESDCFKDHKTNRFKALKRVRPLITRLHELTATPATETYLHLFAQIYLLDQGQRLGKSFTAFKEKYFEENKYTREVKLKEGSAELIAEKISDITLTMKQEDYLSLKECTFVNEYVDLGSEALEKYQQLERDYVVEINGDEVEAETAASLSQKLLQMASGVVYDTKYEEDETTGDLKPVKVVHHLHDHKIEKLKQLLEEFDENVIVAYWHKSSLQRLQKHFPHATTMDKQGNAITTWNKGQIELLLLHPQSSGHGLNIQKGGRRLVFFDIPWSYGLFLQLVGRLQRQGQKLSVYVHLLIARHTLDEAVAEVLQHKGSMQELLFSLLKKYRKRIISSFY